MSRTQKEASCLLDAFKNPTPLLFHLPLFWYLWYRNLLFLYMLVCKNSIAVVALQIFCYDVQMIRLKHQKFHQCQVSLHS